MAKALTENVTIRDIERELARLRGGLTDPGEAPLLRTSSMTHIAWVPERWEEPALQTLAGLAERHPSRGILLFPRPDSSRDCLDAEIDVRCFRNESLGREVCAEVIALRLNGSRASAPASVVLPLLISDLPVFLRWRGDVPFGERPFEELVEIVDRLVVDTGEWEHPSQDLSRLSEVLDRTAVTDIAWARIRPWREALAALWPDIAGAETLRVVGPEAEALLLNCWLCARLGASVTFQGVDRSFQTDGRAKPAHPEVSADKRRLGHEVALVHEPADELRRVEVDGREASPDRADRRTASDLLSEQLDVFRRDPIYEEAICSFSPATT